MFLGNYFHNINKNYKNFSFSGISFDTKTIKKNNIFLLSKEIVLMVINLFLKQLKKDLKLL